MHCWKQCPKQCLWASFPDTFENGDSPLLLELSYKHSLHFALLLLSALRVPEGAEKSLLPISIRDQTHVILSAIIHRSFVLRIEAGRIPVTRCTESINQ